MGAGQNALPDELVEAELEEPELEELLALLDEEEDDPLEAPLLLDEEADEAEDDAEDEADEALFDDEALLVVEPDDELLRVEPLVLADEATVDEWLPELLAWVDEPEEVVDELLLVPLPEHAAAKETIGTNHQRRATVMTPPKGAPLYPLPAQLPARSRGYFVFIT